MALPGQDQIDPRRLMMAQALAGGQLPMSVMPPSAQPGGQADPRAQMAAALQGGQQQPPPQQPPVQMAQAEPPPGQFGGTSLQAQGLNGLVQGGQLSQTEANQAAAGITAPAEIAARVGLAQVFLGQYPAIREIAARGDLTGPVDHATARMGFGEKGEAWRRIESGVDALRRMLTGAGMTANETENYISRYQPSLLNRGEDLVSKLDQLALEVKSVSEIVASGRGLEGLMQRVRQQASGGYQPSQADTPAQQPAGRQPQGGGDWMDLGDGVRIRAVGQ
jgi:hypothetical protein